MRRRATAGTNLYGTPRAVAPTGRPALRSLVGVSSSPLPLSARFALWFSAWTAGATSLDDARDAIVGDDAAHDVVGLPGTDGAGR